MDKIKTFLTSNKYILRVLLLTKRFLVRLFLMANRVHPIERNKVIFMNFDGKGFGDNPKAVAERLHSVYPDAEIVWATIPGYEKTLPDYIRSVCINSASYYKEMATAGVWVNNCRISAAMLKRKGQLYIQLWHGSFPMKKIEKDAEETLDSNYIEHAKHDSSIADIIISGCSFFSKVCRSAFWYNGEILECGTPRLDGIFSVTEQYISEIKEKALLPQNKKIVLYAPTFRVDLSTDSYHIDFNSVLDTLEKTTGEEWAFAIRLHPNVSQKADFIKYNDKIINVTDYPDLYELLPVSDIVITDYSSVMFEAGILEKTVFLFANDIEAYNKDRGMYFDIHNMPFLLAENNSEFIDIIKNFNKDDYLLKLKEFNKEMNYFENGNASQILAERIVKHIKNG